MQITEHSHLRPPLLLDLLLLSITIVLVGFSIVMVYSTTGVISQEKFGDALFYVKRQGVAAILGIGLMLLCSRINLDKIRSISPILFGVSIFLLLLTLVPGVGDAAGGARRWVHLGPLRFQPGEFVKLSVILYMAGFLARHEASLHTFTQGVIKPFLIVGFVAAILLKQPDFGSAVVILLVTLCMTLAAGVRLRYIAICGLTAAVTMAVLVIISPYRMKRVVSFLSPFADASGKGYQLIQSLIAVGTGQVTGVGLGASQQKLFFLPAAHTDFIFAVIAEELGFLGCAAVLALFMLLLWRGLRLASNLADDTYRSSLAVGLTMVIVLPAFLNIGVVTGLLPTKGMVLPFLGYGGSSLIACLVAVGLLLALGRTVHDDR